MAAHDDVTLAVPDDQDAHPLGVMHLESWHQTHPSAEHDIDTAWITETLGFLASPAADDFRRRLLAAQRADPTSTFYRLARRGGDVVGFVHASRTAPALENPAHGQPQTGEGADEVAVGGREARLEALYVLREHQGTGLADRLMEAAFAWLGDQPMRLEVAVYNARAIRFYERHGFVLTGETDLFRGRVPCAVMRRPSSESPPTGSPPGR